MTLFQDYQKLLDAIDAAKARIHGEWDNPALIKYGPLSVQTMDDVLRILNSVETKSDLLLPPR